MIEIKKLSKKSKKIYITNIILLYSYYLMCLILFFQLGRSIIAYHYNLLDQEHLVRVNIYLISIIIMSPTIISEMNYKIRKAKNNEM